MTKINANQIFIRNSKASKAKVAKKKENKNLLSKDQFIPSSEDNRKNNILRKNTLMSKLEDTINSHPAISLTASALAGFALTGNILGSLLGIGFISALSLTLYSLHHS